MNKIILFATMMISLSAKPFAWGPEGHKIVALIAQHYLNDSTKAQIIALNAAKFNHDDLITGDSFMGKHEVDDDLKRFFASSNPQLVLIPNWADGWKFKKGNAGTKPWHFIDLPVVGTVTEATFTSLCPNHSCVLDQIQADITTLKNTNADPEDRIKALFFVVHFVGDIHQPLHCAEENNDQGGNLKKITFFKNNDPKQELHALWDGYILERHQKDQIQFADELIAAVDEAKRTGWENMDVKSWAVESYSIAKDSIYPDFKAKNITQSVPDFEQSDESRFLPIVDTQLEKAGVRLAYLLNTTLGGEATQKPTVTVGHVKVIKATANVYAEANSQSTILKKVKKDDVLDLVDSSKIGKYYKVRVGGKEGYIYGTNVKVK